MIIDLATDHHPMFRQGSLIGAIACAFDKIIDGKRINIDAIYDLDGNKLDMMQARTVITLISSKLGKKFTTRAVGDRLAVIRTK